MKVYQVTLKASFATRTVTVRATSPADARTRAKATAFPGLRSRATKTVEA